MENKIDIAELLKDCPSGMELDCSIFEDVTLYKIDTDIENDFPIRIKTKNDYFLDLTKYGTYSNVEEAKCVIFPKGKTTWEGFVPPIEFKDGDVVCCKDESRGNQLFILKEYRGNGKALCYLFLDNDGTLDTDECVYNIDGLATEEEKQKLFDAIKANGCKWNAETKTLEKLIEPKFKVGDRIQSINFIEERTIKICEEDGYWTTVDTWIRISDQDDWELVPNKFDITTLVPFEDKVLIRNDESQRWLPAFWGYKVVDGFITTFGWCKYCVPYKGNEILFKTNNDCDDFYKTWEK